MGVERAIAGAPLLTLAVACALHRMQAVLRFADGDVELRELESGIERMDRMLVTRDDRELLLYRTRTTHDGRPVFDEAPATMPR